MAITWQSVGSINASATSLIAVTPSDSVALPDGVRALYVGVSGDVAVLAVGDTVSQVFKACPVGVLSVFPKKVLATGTTATNILGLI